MEKKKKEKEKESARWQQGPTDEIEARVKKWTILCLPTSQTHLNSILFTKLVKVVDPLNQSQAQVFFPPIPPSLQNSPSINSSILFSFKTPNYQIPQTFLSICLFLKKKSHHLKTPHGKMAASAHFLQLFQLLAIASLALVMPIYAQINSPCSPSMIASFAPCMAFVTNSSAAGAPPTPACCSALQTISSGGTQCMCQIATGSPFQVPINRTLAISLPRACNMPGVPLQCKAAGAPVSAPGPVAFSPSLSPEAPAPLSPQASTTLPTSDSPGLAPESETSPELTPPSTNTVSSQAPTANPGSRPVVTTSAAHPPAAVSPSLFFTLFGAFVLKCYYY